MEKYHISCDTCIHNSVCYLVKKYGIDTMNIEVGETGCHDFISDDIVKKDKTEKYQIWINGEFYKQYENIEDVVVDVDIIKNSVYTPLYKDPTPTVFKVSYEEIEVVSYEELEIKELI